LPTELPESMARLRGRPAAGGAGGGVFTARVQGTLDAQANAINELRSSLGPGRGSAVIPRGSREPRQRVDVWGPVGDGLALMRAVKQQFDPAGMLNPRRGPGGL